MLTGQIEQEDTGVDPLRGQCNVQGACDMGALPNVFPGYQPVADLLIRGKFENAWRTKLPITAGLTLIMGENPMLSDPTLGKVRETLENLEFLAVADLYLTETAQLADVVLPAASFAEKDGTLTSSERRVQLLRQAIPPIGSCRTDSDIIIALADRLGYTMDYESTASTAASSTTVLKPPGGCSGPVRTATIPALCICINTASPAVRASLFRPSTSRPAKGRMKSIPCC
jgi:predicted molibdopterin-dependent oxidoreductase YjgC